MIASRKATREPPPVEPDTSAGAEAQPDAAAEPREARVARPNQFRLYCFSCGRSTSVAVPPQRPGRCLTCGGTMAIEMETA